MTRRAWVVGVAATIEMIGGGVLLVFVDEPCLLLFGAKPEGAVAPIVRFAGLALLALGFVCLPTRGAISRARSGLFVFNAGGAALFATIGLATAQRGVLLWPAAILHAAIAVSLLIASPRRAERELQSRSS